MEYSEAAGRQEAVVPNQWNLISWMTFDPRVTYRKQNSAGLYRWSFHYT